MMGVGVRVEVGVERSGGRRSRHSMPHRYSDVHRRLESWPSAQQSRSPLKHSSQCLCLQPTIQLEKFLGFVTGSA